MEPEDLAKREEERLAKSIGNRGNKLLGPRPKSMTVSGDWRAKLEEERKKHEEIKKQEEEARKKKMEEVVKKSSSAPSVANNAPPATAVATKTSMLIHLGNIISYSSAQTCAFIICSICLFSFWCIWLHRVCTI